MEKLFSSSSLGKANSLQQNAPKLFIFEKLTVERFPENNRPALCIFSTNRNRQRAPLSLICSVLIGGFQIGQAAPYAEALATARSAAGNIYRVS
jgi:hypothetical protein